MRRKPTIYGKLAKSLWKMWENMLKYIVAYHDQALLDEFTQRGIDISAVHNGKSTYFSQPVRYRLKDNKLIVIN